MACVKPHGALGTDFFECIFVWGKKKKWERLPVVILINLLKNKFSTLILFYININ